MRSDSGQPRPQPVAGLDHGSVDGDVVDLTARADNRLVPESAHDQLQQGADIVVRFADQDAGHSSKNRRPTQGMGSRMV